MRKQLLVCCESEVRMTDEGVRILPWHEFYRPIVLGPIYSVLAELQKRDLLLKDFQVKRVSGME